MIGGGLATVFCLLILAWVREITAGVLGVFGADAQSSGVKVTTLVFATIMMFCLDLLSILVCFQHHCGGTLLMRCCL